MEASLGPPVGSLGVIEEAEDEEGVCEADDGQSAPAQPPAAALPAPARATRCAPQLCDSLQGPAQLHCRLAKANQDTERVPVTPPA